MTARETFLQRVRQAVVEGNRAGQAPPLSERGRIAYQGAGPDPVERFCAEFTAAGGQPFVAPDRAAALAHLESLLRTRQARKVAIGCGGLIEQIDLAPWLRGAGFDVAPLDAIAAPSFRDTLFGVDVGISNVEYLIGETGSVVMATAPREPRSLSLLPPVHIALARPHQILPDLFDLFDVFSPVADVTKATAPPPSCLTIITGPSKTGDIELKLVTGVHGPGEIHVILVND